MTVPDNYSLEQTKDDEVIRFTHLHNSREWSKPLSREQYVDREAVLGQTEICSPKAHSFEDYKFRGLTFWVMRDMSLEYNAQCHHHKTFNIVGACEALFRDGVIIEGEGNRVRKCLTPVIGGVYVQPEYRGMKIAEKMILLLQKHIIELNMEYFHQFPAMKSSLNFITLYSEVGSYYERFGFTSKHIRLIEIDAFANSATTATTSGDFLKVYENENLVNNYRDSLIEFSQIKTRLDGKARFMNLPSLNLIEWHHRRSLFISKTLNVAIPVEFGFKIDESNFIIWTHDYKNNNLLVINLNATSFENFKIMIESSLIACSRFNFRKVVVWESDLNVDSILFGSFAEEHNFKSYSAKFEQIHSDMIKYLFSEKKSEFTVNGSIPCFKILDFDSGNVSNEYIWEGNGKLPWF